MALRPDRYIPDGGTDISFFMNEVAERGVVVCYSTGGSGAALDQSDALVTVKADPSGFVPAGLLLCDMVDKDLTKTHLNYNKDEVQKGSKVPLLKKGWVVTDKVVASTTPTVGQKAYVKESGLLSNIGNSQEQKVGRFEGSKDEDGFVKVYINIPL